MIWVQRLLCVELAVTPSLVISPSVPDLQPCHKCGKHREGKYGQRAKPGQQSLHLPPLPLPDRPFQPGNAPPPFFTGGIFPNLERCIFCIAANRLVFTSPIVHSSLRPYHIDRITRVSPSRLPPPSAGRCMHHHPTYQSSSWFESFRSCLHKSHRATSHCKTPIPRPY